MSAQNDNGGRLARLRARVTMVGEEAAGVRLRSVALADEATGHGWAGVAGGLRAGAEGIERAEAALTLAEAEAAVALGVVPDGVSTSLVAEQLSVSVQTLDTCGAHLDAAAQALGEVRPAIGRTTVGPVIAAVLRLGEQVDELRRLLAEAREAVETERREAAALGRAVAGEGASSRRPKIQGPAARWALRLPNIPRHALDRITGDSRRRESNTVILPGTDVAADVAAIEDGRARWNSDSNRYETPSGRTYGVKPGGLVFPDEGPGLAKLNRAEYRALQYYIEADGDERRAEAAMDRNETMRQPVRHRAYEVFRRHRSFRG